MKLYFNYTQNFILADCEGEVIDMRTGQPTDAALIATKMKLHLSGFLLRTWEICMICQIVM